MSSVIVDMGMSLDGYIAGPNGGPQNPLGDGGTLIHRWVYDLASWRESLGLAGSQTNRDDEVVKESNARVGAYVMGRRMFDEGEVGWPDPPSFRAPVFVLTNNVREPWVRQGGTTFTFVTDGIERPRASKSGRGRRRRQDRGRRERRWAVHRSRTGRRAADPPRPRAARRRGPVVRSHRPEAHRTGRHAGHRLPQGNASRVPPWKAELK
jgi:dihydrofolate reductase